MRKLKMRLKALRMVLTTKNFILFGMKVKNGEPFGNYVCRTDFENGMDVLLVEKQLERMKKSVTKSTK